MVISKKSENSNLYMMLLACWMAAGVLSRTSAGTANEIQEDPIAEVLREYTRESLIVGQSKNYDVYRAEFWDKWFNRLWSLREEYPNSHERLNLTRTLVSLANGLEIYEVSADLAGELLNSSNDSESKNRWHHELGDIFYRQYLRSNDAAYARKAVDHFGLAMAELDNIQEQDFVEKRAAHIMSDAYCLGNLTASVLKDYASAADSY